MKEKREDMQLEGSVRIRIEDVPKAKFGIPEHIYQEILRKARLREEKQEVK